MKSVATLLAETTLEKLALFSNLRYGRAIYRRGAVEIIEQTPEYIEGWVGGLDGAMVEGGGQRRRVKLSSSSKGLTWHCAGNPKNHQIFCKHCVALALFIQSNA